MSCTVLTNPTPYSVLDTERTSICLKAEGELENDLLGLPDELKLEVLSYIDRKRDLYHLSLTCHELENMTVGKLYENVDIEIPRSKHLSCHIGKLPAFRAESLQAIKELTIRNGLVESRDQVYNKRKRSEVGSLDDYACDLLSRMPENMLRSFGYMHQNSLTAKTLEAIAVRHGEALRKLCYYELELLEQPNTPLPSRLTSLSCSSVQCGGAFQQLIEKSRSSLEVLHIGQEKALVEQYRRSRIGFLEQVIQPTDAFTTQLRLGRLPKLRHLSLVGLNAARLLPHSLDQALFFCNLESITLESCLGSADFLDSVSSTFNFTRHTESAPRPQMTPRLRSFVFRHEALTNLLKDTLITFLGSFQGLENLTLLFENATLLERPASLIANHGRTLKTLVVESRIQPREHLGLDTSRPLGMGGYTHELWQGSISDICDLCPGLNELGMGFPWNDEVVRLRKTKLPTLKDLKTVHVRNFPQSEFLSQLGDYAIQEYARKFVEWSFPSLVGGSRPALETLAIGPTLYENRWKYNYHNPPEYLKTHYFCIDWAKTRFGRWNAMITPVSERYMEELREERPLRGVFEHVWLR